MDFYDVLRERFSLRSYDPDKKIPDDTLERILNAGRIAPSASNKQPWKFLVIKNPQLKSRIQACYSREWLKNAPVILVAVGNKDDAWIRHYDGHNSIEVDLTIALDHMILAATAEGVGSCWILAYDPDILRRELGLQKNEYVSSITPLGYPPDDYIKKSRPERKDLDEILEIR